MHEDLIDVIAFKEADRYVIRLLTPKAQEFMTQICDGPTDDTLWVPEEQFHIMFHQITGAGLLLMLDDSDVRN